MNIEIIVDALLKEEIGHFLCDSGGAYGYQYERNREQGYLKGFNPVEEYTNEETGERSLEVTIPVYDFLTYNLVKDYDTCCLEKRIFNEFEINGINPYHIFDVADFLNSNSELFGIENEVKYINTYNYEEFLSQTIQYALLEIGCDDYIILQVHNGCDVRSGYTKPQLFRVKEYEYFISGQFDRVIECDCGLNIYFLYGSDEYVEPNGDIIDEGLVYDRTYIDDEGNVRCRDCNSIIKGGFIEW